MSLENHLETRETLQKQNPNLCVSTQMEASKEQSRGDWKAWLDIQAAANRCARDLGKEEHA